MLNESTRFLIFAHIAAAAIWLVIGSAYGVILASKLWAPEFLTYPLMSFGRIRPIHTGGILLGWLTLVFIGLSLLVVCRSSRRSLWSSRLGWLGLVCINLALILATITLSVGVTRGPLEYREWVTPIAAIMAVGILSHGFNVLMTLHHRKVEEMYISNWYILGAYVWLPTLYVLSYIPVFDQGPSSMIVQGYYMHVVLGLWFTPMAIGITYWALPRALSKPIYSYSLGVLAFWSNLFFYTLIGAHHFILSPVPWWLQSTAAMLGLGMMIPVWSTVINFSMTMKGSWKRMRRQPPVWFILAGTITYGLVSLQGALQGLRGFNQLIHFTNYTVAHAHWAAYGFASFLAFGCVYALLPRLNAGDWAPDISKPIQLHFWFALAGILIYAISMTASGIIQGLDWANGRPFVESLIGIKPYMLARLIGGGLMAVSHLIFLWVVWRLRPWSLTRSASVAPVHAEPAE